MLHRMGPEDLSAMKEVAQAAGGRMLLIESAGLFWLLAELLILLAVWLGGRRYRDRRSALFPLSRFEWAMGACAFLGAALGTGAVLALHRSYSPEAEETVAAVVAAMRARELYHLALWSAFVLGWVILEAAIVFAGWRVYRQIRRRVAVP